MTLYATAEIAAPPETVFDRISDVRHWPDWLTTITSVTPLAASGPDAVGARYAVVQPGLPKATWQITDWQPGRSFTWESSGPGLRATATHVVQRAPAGTRASLGIQWNGPLAFLARALWGRRGQRYVDTEAALLKEQCEAA
jgi:uncharacterized protein YndB with AHSA1/START domain